MSVATHHNLVVIGASGYSDVTNSSIPSGSAYIFERHSGGTDNWGQIDKLIANDATDEGFLGWSVAVNKNNAVAGANQGF